jgi:hypothetical protein
LTDTWNQQDDDRSKVQPDTENDDDVVEVVQPVQPCRLTPETVCKPEGSKSVKESPVMSLDASEFCTVTFTVAVWPMATMEAENVFVTVGPAADEIVIGVAGTTVDPLPDVVTVNEGFAVAPTKVPFCFTLKINVHEAPTGSENAPAPAVSTASPESMVAVAQGPVCVTTWSTKRIPAEVKSSTNVNVVIGALCELVTVIVAKVEAGDGPIMTLWNFFVTVGPMTFTDAGFESTATGTALLSKA